MQREAQLSIKSTSSKLTSILEFCYEHGGISYDPVEFQNSLEGFIRNDTYSLVEKDGEIVAFCIWNIDGDVAQVEEAIIHKEHRRKGLLRYMALLGLTKFPYLKKIRFCRERKYIGRPPRETDLLKFIRR